MVFSSRTFRRRLAFSMRKSKKKTRKLRRRKQKGGNNAGMVPYRGIPKNAVVVNPMNWQA
uniref:Uncharacterized protein n=1 Tax=viral metagenome TaxID=1070528 RepID=A0A6C0DQ16_9ZZZZ